MLAGVALAATNLPSGQVEQVFVLVAHKVQLATLALLAS
jgi:hypothetical protein